MNPYNAQTRHSALRVLRGNDRLKSIAATVLIHIALGYLLLVGMGINIPMRVIERMTLINLVPDRPPPPPQKMPPPTRAQPTPSVTPIVEPPIHAATRATAQPEAVQDWATLTPWARILAVVRTQKWVVEYVSAEQKRFTEWRAAVPQGSGGNRVTRVQPPNLATHTIYWPATWSNGLMPIIAWGNGSHDMCFNNSLQYAAFLGEVASHGYFIVAVGNDDIDYPLPNGGDVTKDGRSIKTQAVALRKGIDWAIAENSRAGSPYAGKLDTSKIAYMGHGCGGGQAMETAASDPRTTTTVLLNSTARFRARPVPVNPETGFTSEAPFYKAPIAFFEGWQDDGGVINAGDANFNRAREAEWPYFIAALNGMAHDNAYPGPDPRWCSAVIAWLNWQLKGDSNGLTTLNGLSRRGWTNISSTNL